MPGSSSRSFSGSLLSCSASGIVTSKGTSLSLRQIAWSVPLTSGRWFVARNTACVGSNSQKSSRILLALIRSRPVSCFTSPSASLLPSSVSTEATKRALKRSYLKVQEWVDRVAADYEDGKQVSYTRLGRRRLQVPGVPAALNTPIQAGATDVMKAIAVAAHEGLRPTWEIVGLVHDEILVLVPESDAVEAKDWLHQIMIKVGGEATNQGVPKALQVEVDAGTHICDTWAEKDYPRGSP